jgi:hypothetical protein
MEVVGTSFAKRQRTAAARDPTARAIDAGRCSSTIGVPRSTTKDDQLGCAHEDVLANVRPGSGVRM